MTGYPPDIDALSAEALKELVLWLLERDAAWEAEVAALREEIVRVKGLKGRPKLKPSGMERATEGKAGRGKGKRRGGGGKTARLAIDEDRIVKAKIARTFPKNSGEAEGELGEVFGLV
jgi:hypothetical protein